MSEPDDSARQRILALERRVSQVERDVRTVKTWMLMLAGLVVAALVVDAFEHRRIFNLIERLIGWHS